MPASSQTVARLTIPADAEYLGICRLAATGVAGSVGLHDEQVSDLQLAVSEVCADAIVHSRPEATVEVTMRLPDGEIEVAVRSPGSGPHSPPQMLAMLLDRLATRWNVAGPAGGDVVVTFAVSRPPG